MAIHDQRTMSGAQLHTSVEDVEAFWQQHADAMRAKLGFAFAEARSSQAFVEEADELVAYVNHSRWVADCPYCNAGIALWHDNPRAACLSCGRIYTSVRWPRMWKQLADLAESVTVPDEHVNWRAGMSLVPLNPRLT